MSIRFCLSVLLMASFSLASCRSDAPDKIVPLAPDMAWSLEKAGLGIRKLSCREMDGPAFSIPLTLQVETVMLGNAGDLTDALSGVAFAGGWVLSSENGAFGGLSGIDMMPGGNLLTVSDDGAFIELGFSSDMGQPSGKALLSYMLGEDGSPFSGKADGDAEGLDYTDGIAFVSFERNHRVLAFDRAGCGGAARGVLVSAIGFRPASLGHSIRENGGAEAVALADGRLEIGLEAGIDGMGPTAIVDADGTPRFDAVAWLDSGGVPLVGLDWVGGALYSLHRAYNPLTGNTIIVQRTDASGTKRLAKLDRPLTVDNFEGITAIERPDGSIRLFLIADDNFSDRQRTLLYAFDVL